MPILLSVTIQNHPGALAELLETVAQAGLNIHAVEAEALGDFGNVRLLIADPVRGAKFLQEKGYEVVEAPVLEVKLPNRSGELARVVRKLADAKVNIVSLFGTTPLVGNDPGRILLRCNDLDKALKVLDKSIATR